MSVQSDDPTQKMNAGGPQDGATPSSSSPGSGQDAPTNADAAEVSRTADPPNAADPRRAGNQPNAGDPRRAGDPPNTNAAEGANPRPNAAAGDELETLRGELAEIEQKADEYLRLAQRTQADFINYRRRIEEERAQQARDANIAFLQKLFPILDDFERAMKNASDAERQSSWGQGVQLVERNLRSLVAADGVEVIDAQGADFDPRLHEAVGSAPSADLPEGKILHVARQGYRKGDRVLRPTQVVVSSRPQN